MSQWNIILFEKQLRKFINFTIKNSVAYSILAFIGLFFISALVIMILGIQNISARIRVSKLQNENQRLKAELLVVRDKLAVLDEKLKVLAELDMKIRLASNLELIPKELRDLGYGGLKDENLIAEVDHLLLRARFQEESFNYLSKFLEEKSKMLAHTPSIWPTSGFLSSGFGYRRSPFTGRSEFHEGIDIVAPPGQLVYATADGIVRYAGYKAGYGRYIEIDHGYGHVTCYAHLQSVKVQVGQKVKRGDIIGHVGSSGAATGPHLHYAIRVNGSWVNPLNYILTEYAGK
ncbi:MAG: M23 family metallopeptidase [candidate division WOR-3 bacterium]|nr:M23 family metallopeptidase [candidate division WOR-3 bacterium]MCX7757743.1 M23 family metallopeptidase [candidate division WOR-3 bacterium]MDW7987827.1 M23 family metallopeptidase [candidate division WOR-3 bacterium]